MTAREIYEAVLIELNKVGAPDLLLDEFNYYINKGLYQYVQKRYNVYDSNQQTTDDLQVLKETKILQGDALKHIGQKQTTSVGDIVEAKYKTHLPDNYFHLLNCVLTYALKKDYRCWSEGYKIDMPAKRITSDAYSSILNNAWLKPQYKQPYYVIDSNDLTIEGDWANNDIYDNQSIKDKIKIKAGKMPAHNGWEDVNGDNILSSGDKLTGPTMIIDYGKDNSIFELVSVNVNFLKVPNRVRITPEQIDMTEDHSQIMEFPDYVSREIIKEVVSLIMLRNGDPSLQAQMAVNTSVPQGGGRNQSQQNPNNQ